MVLTVIGISGASSSGKSTLANNISELGDDIVTVFHQDDFYREKNEITARTVSGNVNWDTPEAFNIPELISQVQRTVIGGKNEKNSKLEFVVIEGMTIFADPTLRKFIDIFIWLEIDKYTAFTRRIARKESWAITEAKEQPQYFEECTWPYYKSYRKLVLGKGELDLPRDEGIRCFRINGNLSPTLIFDIVLDFVEFKMK